MGIRDRYERVHFIDKVEYYQMTYDAAVEGIVAALFITFYPKVIKTQVAPQSIFHGLA